MHVTISSIISQLKMQVPERMMVTCIKSHKGAKNKISCSYEPMRLAPGMKTNISLVLCADIEGVTECELRMFEVSSKMELRRTIKASIVPVASYSVDV